jgi:iron complex transport system substrate-binding protein
VNVLRKWLGSLAAVLILAAGLSACGASNQGAGSTNAPTEKPANSQAATPSPASAARTVVDQAGDTVVIPPNVQRVVITFQPFGSIYPLFVGSAKTLVGMLPGSMFAAKYSLLKSAYPEILKVDTSFYQNNEVNLESVLNLKPDLVLYTAGDDKQKEFYRKMGIPALGFSVNAAEFDTVKTYISWVKILGQAFGMEEKAAAIIEYNQKNYDDIQKRLSTLKESDKKKILVLNGYDATSMGTSGGKQFPDYWARGSGGINASAGAFTGNKQITIEQVYEWDPDIIYLADFSPYSAEELIQNKARKGHDWSTVRAAKNGTIYKFPLGMFRWYPPNSESILSLWWMSKTNYPELFADIDVNQKIREYYSTFYGYKLTDEELESIYHPASEASGASK